MRHFAKSRGDSRGFTSGQNLYISGDEILHLVRFIYKWARDLTLWEQREQGNGWGTSDFIPDTTFYISGRVEEWAPPKDFLNFLTICSKWVDKPGFMIYNVHRPKLEGDLQYGHKFNADEQEADTGT